MENFNLYIVIPPLLCFVIIFFYNTIPGILRARKINKQVQTMKILREVRNNTEKERLERLRKWRKRKNEK